MRPFVFMVIKIKDCYRVMKNAEPVYNHVRSYIVVRLSFSWFLFCFSAANLKFKLINFSYG